MTPRDTAASTVPAMPQVSDRVAALHGRMTLEEKVAQIVGYWLDQGGEVVAPMQGEMAAGQAGTDRLSEITRHGIGHYTRVYGTRPVDPVDRARWLWDEQRRLKETTRLGIPALVHEECLTGLAAWKAATFPTPLAWGASFDPRLVEEMGALIGESMRSLGIHQGLAPVLDVVQDPRWGRVDECIGEDPYLVGTVGTAYVRGMQESGVHATLKHFVGYSGSQAGRNHAPVSAGPREIADTYLPPFEMAVRDGDVRSVMASYNDIDGVPQHSSREYLTGVLREQWGFDGTVVADYFGVAFLEVMHAVAADRADAAATALAAGLDIELPSGDAFLEPLVTAVRDGRVDETLVDRAVLRALKQKEDLGLLDDAAFGDEPPAVVDLDSPRHRAVARKLADESVVLLSNDGVLPLSGWTKTPSRVAVVGPNAHRTDALMGCYSFANHVLAHHPEFPLGFEIPTVFDSLTGGFCDVGSERPALVHARGCDVEDEDTSGFGEAVAAASSADVAVVVVGDQAGLFGRGTVGEGNDSESLDLPGVQRELVEAVIATGTPVVMVVLSGRPYAIDWALEGDRRPGAVLQAFFPGEEGGASIAGVIAGSVNPSGRLPVSLPRSSGSQPYTYLHPILGGPSDVTSTDSTPLRPFGFGLSYTEFEYSELTVDSTADSAGAFTASVRVTNTGEVAGADVVQLYGRDLVASVTRPVAQLLAYERVALEPGESVVVAFNVPMARLAFADRGLRRIVEPGDVEVWVGSHVAAVATQESEELRHATGGAITNSKAATKRALPGSATSRAVLTVQGGVHEVTGADARIATAVVAR